VLGFASGLATVRNAIPDPPFTQRVFPTDTTPPGIPRPGYSSIGGPVVTANSIFPKWSDDETGFFGTPRAQVNSIFVQGMPAYFDPDFGGQFGLPSFNQSQSIFVGGIEAPLAQVPAVRISPHTIYAPIGAPDQAIANHPSNVPHPIDFFVNKSSTAIVSNYYRSFSVGGYDSALFGEHRLSRDPEGIAPTGFRAQKFGVPVFRRPNEILAQSFVFSWDFGEAQVSAPEPLHRAMAISGIASLEMARPSVEFFNRLYAVQSIAPGDFGAVKVQRPPPPVEPMGEVMSLWGGPLVAYRIRSFDFDGFDSFVCDYDPSYFRLRLRVTRRNFVRPMILDGGQIGGHGIGHKLPIQVAPQGVQSWPMQPYQKVEHA
jgi:hypothetical protein